MDTQHPIRILQLGEGNFLRAFFDWMVDRMQVQAGYDGPVNLEVIGAAEYALNRCAIIAAESYGYLNAILKANGGR